MSICRAHKRTQPKYSHSASSALRVPTAPQTHESLCCSEAVDIQDDEHLQRCCGTAGWRQLADSWKRLIFNQVQCQLCVSVCVWLYGCVCIQLLRFGSRLLYLFTRHNKFLLASILRFKSAAVISHHIHSFTSSQIRVSDPDFCAWLVRTLEVYVYVRVHSVLEKSLKMLEFGIKNSRYLKVLENR